MTEKNGRVFGSLFLVLDRVCHHIFIIIVIILLLLLSFLLGLVGMVVGAGGIGVAYEDIWFFLVVLILILIYGGCGCGGGKDLG